MAWSAAESAGGLVAAVAVEAEVAHELCVVEHGGVVVVDDDGDVAAGPCGADTDAEPVDEDDAVVVDGDVVRLGACRRLGCGNGRVAGMAGVVACQRDSGVTRAMPWWGRCSL